MEPVSPSPGTRTVAPEPGAPGAHPSSWGIGGLHLWPGNTEYLGVSCRPTPRPKPQLLHCQGQEGQFSGAHLSANLWEADR